MQQGNDPKHTDKATKEHFRANKRNDLDSRMTSIQPNICLAARDQTEGTKKPPKHARSEAGCRTGLTHHEIPSVC